MFLKANSKNLPAGLHAFAAGSCGRVYKADNGSLWGEVFLNEESIDPDGFAPVVEEPETENSEADYVFADSKGGA